MLIFLDVSPGGRVRRGLMPLKELPHQDVGLDLGSGGIPSDGATSTSGPCVAHACDHDGLDSRRARVGGDGGGAKLARDGFDPGKAIALNPELHRVVHGPIHAVLGDADDGRASFHPHVLIVRAVDHEDADRGAILGGRVHRSRDRCDRGDEVAEFHRDAVGHHAPVAHAGDVYASGVDALLGNQMLDQGAEERDVIDLGALRVAAAVPSVPREQAVGLTTRPIGIHHHESVLPCKGGHLTHLLGGAGVATPAVKDDDGREALGRWGIRRGPDDEGAIAVADAQGLGVGLGRRLGRYRHGHAGADEGHGEPGKAREEETQEASANRHSRRDARAERKFGGRAKWADGARTLGCEMVSRRDLLMASTAALALGSLPGVAGQATPAPARKRALRLAHLTDIHVQPERQAQKGFEAALAHVQSQKDAPGLILTGGDLIMDAMGATKERSQKQWDIFTEVLKTTCRTPIEHTIGNHDVFGWGTGDRFANDPGYGKAWACDVLGKDKPYRSFDRAGWHFIVLDSTFRAGNGYTARLDEPQFEWLAGDLQKTPVTTPVLIISHIPILGVAPFLDGENEKTGNWVVPGAWMHLDARRLKDLFRKHPNVKLCLSGHMHLVDRAEYLGVTYCCNGAVSGGWWGGDYHETTYGYGLVDLYDDGSFENQYQHYGWTTKS